MKHPRSVVFMPSKTNISDTDHLVLLCQMIDAATESERPETEQTAVA